MTVDDVTRFNQDMDGSMEPDEQWRWVRSDDIDAAIAQAVERETAELRAQVSRLSADAERYRWLRQNCVSGRMESRGPLPDFAMNCDEPASEWDAAIDAILATKEQP